MDELARRRWRRRLLAALVAGGALAMTGGAAVFRLAVRYEPDFYRSALQMEPQDQQAAGVQLEQSVAGLHHQVRSEGPWSTTITAEQINGWLASDLPQKFPNWLPKEVSSPRIDLAPDCVQLAFALETATIKGVICVVAQMQLTAQPNEIAVRLRGARLGALPLPLSRVVQEITRAAEISQSPLRWTHEANDPVAVVRLDLRESQRGESVILHSLQVVQGELRLGGISGPAVNATAALSSDPVR